MFATRIPTVPATFEPEEFDIHEWKDDPVKYAYFSESVCAFVDALFDSMDERKMATAFNAVNAAVPATFDVFPVYSAGELTNHYPIAEIIQMAALGGSYGRLDASINFDVDLVMVVGHGDRKAILSEDQGYGYPDDYMRSVLLERLENADFRKAVADYFGAENYEFLQYDWSGFTE